MKKLLEWLKETLGEKILAILLAQLLTKEKIIEAVDAALDFCEELAAKTETTIDDAALKAIRDALQIPKDDQPIV